MSSSKAAQGCVGSSESLARIIQRIRNLLAIPSMSSRRYRNANQRENFERFLLKDFNSEDSGNDNDDDGWRGEDFHF